MYKRRQSKNSTIYDAQYPIGVMFCHSWTLASGHRPADRHQTSTGTAIPTLGVPERVHGLFGVGPEAECRGRDVNEVGDVGPG